MGTKDYYHYLMNKSLFSKQYYKILVSDVTIGNPFPMTYKEDMWRVIARPTMGLSIRNFEMIHLGEDGKSIMTERKSDFIPLKKKEIDPSLE
jgi:hypothetical protein